MMSIAISLSSRRLLLKAASLVLSARVAGLPALGQTIALQQPPSEAQLTAGQIDTRANDLMRAGKFSEADALLRQELLTNPQSHAAHAALAYCLLRENQPAKALEEYTRAAAISPPDSQELTRVGQAYVLLGDDTDADHWTLRAVRMNPSDAEAWYSLGRIRYTEQRFADAATCFEHVLSLSPRNVKAENNLGLAEDAMNRTDAAVAAYRQAIAWESPPAVPGDEQPYLNLAIVLLHTGAMAEAQTLLAHALAISPHDPRIFEQIGQVHLQQNDPAAAADAFREAVHLDPKNSGLHFLLGQAYRRLGKKEQAQTEFDTAALLSRAARATTTP